MYTDTLCTLSWGWENLSERKNISLPAKFCCPWCKVSHALFNFQKRHESKRKNGALPQSHSDILMRTVNLDE